MRSRYAVFSMAFPEGAGTNGAVSLHPSRSSATSADPPRNLREISGKSRQNLCEKFAYGAVFSYFAIELFPLRTSRRHPAPAGTNENTEQSE